MGQTTGRLLRGAAGRRSLAVALLGVWAATAACGAGVSTGQPTALPFAGSASDRASGQPTKKHGKRVKAASSASSTTAVATSDAPDVKVRTETLTRRIKFKTVTRRDPDLDKGDTRVVRAGVPGLLELTFRVTYTDGERTGRELVEKRRLREPVTRIVAVGTRVPPPQDASCNPNYTGACVPIDSDVDCAGGSGNGPSYVVGPVRVVGTDVYDLDRDGDGIGCD